ncbi:uncharacterized protein LOC107616491 [Arachis ipaensis]|uniref:uncharacterized protein LOC107616491 n=1 Tax=Arachis ipaensis TaxID=130454 RepID=UPI0007AF5124|nr:uncharacterized protein LOC107616491 [Arachis ipaensis]
MAEVPRGVKNSKITTKFDGEVGESTTEYIARYLVEIGNLANDENLKMKFFPSSLTKNAFTWFSNLRPNSITTWNQLETAFHAQIYRGKMNVAVTDLVALKCEDGETIDDYLIHFKNARSRCYVTLPESEIVPQTELMKKEKEKHRIEQRSKNKPFTRKEKVAYVTMESSEEEFDFETEVNLAELKKGPPYVCSLLKKLPGSEKSNNSKLKSEKKYSFDISKSD